MRIVEQVSSTRYRALARDGRAALVDETAGSPRVTAEPRGAPLSSMSLPLYTRYCASLGRDLAVWALQQAEGWRMTFDLADVYATFDVDCATVTGVIPSGRTAYAPPEVLARAPLLAHGDVFMICAIVAHLATGEHPFHAGEQGVRDGVRRAFWGDPNVAVIVDRGLNRDPAKRGTLERLLDDFAKLGSGV